MKHLTESDKDAIIALYQTGAWPLKELARRFKVSSHTEVRRFLLSRGVKMRPAHRPLKSTTSPLGIVWAELAPMIAECMRKAEKRQSRRAA